MKSSLIGIALLFSSFILNGQTITDLNLSETEYARIDSFIKEIVYRHEAGEFKHLSDNEIRKFITNELRLFIPANKLSQFEQMVLAEEQVRSREELELKCKKYLDTEAPELLAEWKPKKAQSVADLNLILNFLLLLRCR